MYGEGTPMVFAWRREMSRLLSMVFTGVVMVGGLSGTVRAENWADTLFTERSHDFGPVPPGTMDTQVKPGPMGVHEGGPRSSAPRRRRPCDG